MSITYSATEIVNMAIAIEENGMAFYNAMATMAGDKKSKEVYNYLAKEEVGHKVLFQKMFDKLSIPEMTPSEEEEYNSYFKALTSSRVFKKDINVEEIIKEAGDEKGALDMAINFEKDSILFFYELMEKAIESEKKSVELVIKEEKDHLAKLVFLRKWISE